ncbi:LysR substrate-binding protein [Frankia canadensis]|uniref:LysR substrate-binding protein n=1 Tax=Frankia canadensis TaxID=1836972 RepID=A0A2I2L0C6_9ACTN|nr:LysR family transcriptional regulator [Frankia canadensis]SNQ51327.1 LysR substrate-binding protein [Frankia canadensis]SOU58617.1 LysR substrate-binding protein [Frankia canadensis]
MTIELRHLRAFVAVAEDLHFTRAAQRLHLAQPAISQQIRQLESAVGATLLVRGPGGTRLSDAGRVFLPEARRTLAQAEAAVVAAREANQGETGTLRVGYAPTASSPAFLPLLVAYRNSHPRVDLGLRELPLGDLSDVLLTGVVDLAFAARTGPPDYHDGVAIREIAHEPFVLAVPESHRLAGQAAAALLDLADEPFVMQSRDQCSEYHDAIQTACLRAGFSPRCSHTTTELSAQLALVAAGLAVTLVPASTSVLRAADVRYLALTDDAPHITSYAAWRSGDEKPVLRRLLDMLGMRTPPNAASPASHRDGRVTSTPTSPTTT